MSVLGAFIVPHPPLIIPQVGMGQEKEIQKTIDSYEQVGRDVAALSPETIVVISPHSIMYADYIHISPGEGARGDFGNYNAPQVSIEKSYDTEFVAHLEREAEAKNIPAGTLGERDPELDHATMIPLYFIDRELSDYQIIRIGISGISLLEQYRFGQCIAHTAEKLGRKTVIIASGDLSHKLSSEGPYGFKEEGPSFDKQVTEAMASADFMRFLTFGDAFTDAAAECGLRSFVQMAGALDEKDLRTDFLSYEGPYGVGYAVCEYHIIGIDTLRNIGDQFERMEQNRLAGIKENEDPYVRLARKTLEHFIKTRRKITRPDDLPEELTANRAGVFVSLKKDGKLRGCIGTIDPTQDTIADEIIRNAIEAGERDPRFNPVSEEELASLVYSVDVLGHAEPIASIDELDAKRYGVIVSKGNRSGLLLPNLEGVDSPEEQIQIALQKAGIARNEDYKIERFEVVRHK